MGNIVDMQEYRRSKAEGEHERMTKLEFEARREYMESYISIARQAQETAEELIRLQHDIGPGAQVMDGMPRGGKKTDGSDRIVGRMEGMEKLRKSMHREIASLTKKRDEIAAVIDGLPAGKMWEVLRCLYIQGYDLGKTADIMHYSYRQLQNIHDRALFRIKPPAYAIKKIKESLMEIHPEWASIEKKCA